MPQHTLPAALNRRSLLVAGAAALAAPLLIPDRAAAGGQLTIPIGTWVSTASGPYVNQTMWTTNRDAIRVGKSSSDGAVWRALLQADITALAGLQIVAAAVRIELDHSWSCAPTPVQLWPLQGILVPGSPTTWASTQSWWAPSPYAVLSAAANDSCGQGNIIVQFSGSSLVSGVQAAVNAGQTKLPVGIRAQQETDFTGWKRFVPSTAYLQVTFA